MCGIAGAVDLRGRPIPGLRAALEVMNDLLEHRGPDDSDLWVHEHGHVGLAHRRLSIIDIAGGHQPMSDDAGRWITYNGEVYNYSEVRREAGGEFRTDCDTEVVLAAYDRWGPASLDRFRGMFAYAIWDEPTGELFIARDRFGIKPLVYSIVDGVLWFASEAKALLPVLPEIRTDVEGLKDYLAFQFCLAGKTLFDGISELPPGHFIRAGRNGAQPQRYWEVFYEIDWDHAPGYFETQVRELLEESVELHLRSDVPIASYLSGGLDSSAVATLATKHYDGQMSAFNGRFPDHEGYDESVYARSAAERGGLALREVDIRANDFVELLPDVIRHLDYPVAGPGAFPQYVVSRAVGSEVKVVLGGQGGDEVFGGYTRYLIAYFEQCIKAAIDGTLHDGRFVVTYESIIPNLIALQGYEPLLQNFWSSGLFEPMDARYFRLINRTPDLRGEVRLDALGAYSPFETFQAIFNGSNVGHQAYFDKMTHFDFKTLLPALLQVEDRVAMAHSLESRVPFLDHRLVEFAASIPADVKFKDGHMKHVFRRAIDGVIPNDVLQRKDKMGFPVPLTEWMRGPAREFVLDTLTSSAARSREYFDNSKVVEGIETEGRFGRKTWGLLCLEIWQRQFHDHQAEFKRLLTEREKGTTLESGDHRRSGLHRLAPGRPTAGG